MGNKFLSAAKTVAWLALPLLFTLVVMRDFLFRRQDPKTERRVFTALGALSIVEVLYGVVAVITWSLYL